jgi:hypothetical protein
MRSSHLPLYTLFFFIYVWVLVRREPRPSLSFSLATLACFAVGYASFGWMLIRPLIPDGPHTNRTYHVVAHPLVLGLALPPSDLSRREGIVWNDDAGLALARRMIPEATYLGPDYERALFRYYRSLWRKYPGEMIRIYWSKLAMAGRGMFPVAWLNGIVLMVLYIGALVISFWVWRRHRRVLFLLFALLSLAAVALMLEAVAVVPDFRIMYQAYLLIYTELLVVFALQALADVMSGRVQNRRFAKLHAPANH